MNYDEFMSELTPRRVIARLQERQKSRITGARWDLQETAEACCSIDDRSQIVMARPVPEERRDQTLRFVARNNDDIDRILAEVGAKAEANLIPVRSSSRRRSVSNRPPTP